MLKNSPSKKRAKSPTKKAKRFNSPKSGKSVSSPSKKRRSRSASPDGRAKNTRIADPIPIAKKLADFLNKHYNLLTDNERAMVKKNMFSRPRISSFASRYSKRRAQVQLNKDLGHPGRFAFWADAGMANILGRDVDENTAVTYAQLQKKMSRFFNPA